jgi:hypothetical protein
MEDFQMKLVKTLSVLTLAGLLLLGCDGFGGPRLDVQTFNLEHRSGYEAAELIDPYVFSDREESPGDMSATMEALTVRETRDNLEKIARVLEEYDQPIPGIRLRFQLIEADSYQEEDAAIADVVDELRSLFRFQGYRLLGEAMVPIAGGAQGTQQFSQRFLGVDNPITVEAAARITSAGTVRLDPVQLRDTWDELMAATVNITPGQTIVIGGTQVRTQLVDGSPAGRSVLILTVRAERE